MNNRGTSIKKIRSVDRFIQDEWVIGWKPDWPWVVEPPRTFTKEDEKRLWIFDFHTPHPISPMCYSTWFHVYAWSMQINAEFFSLPRSKGQVMRVTRGFAYLSQVDVESEEEVKEREVAFEDKMKLYRKNFKDIWRERLAEITTGLRFFDSNDLTKASLPELREHLGKVWRFYKRIWEIHFEIMYFLQAQSYSFRQICVNLGITSYEASKFLQGYENKALECDKKLWHLANLAIKLDLKNVFEQSKPEDIVPKLLTSNNGNTWLDEFHQFLKMYGNRCTEIFDVATPTWREDPTIVLQTLKTYIAQGSFDFEARWKATVEEREKAIVKALAKIPTEEGKTKFKEALQQTQIANFAWWNEEHNFYIDQWGHAVLRMVILEIGKRLAQKDFIKCPDDVFFMVLEELREAIKDPESYDWQRMSALIEARKEYNQIAERIKQELPRFLGTIPERIDDVNLIELFGITPEVLQSLREGIDLQLMINEIKGIAGSPGVAEGYARVIWSPESLGDVQPGDIVVCVATTPSWTPIFSKIRAIVADEGGFFAHAAIIAREYQIPAVVGTVGASKLIKTGQRIRVDGDKGTVTILGSAT